jgi:hypothetical protein
MYDRAWQVPQDQFVAAWNASESLADAANRVKALAGEHRGVSPTCTLPSRRAYLSTLAGR